MHTIRIDMSAANWRKSTYSNQDGGECLEVAEVIPASATWRKSSYSNTDGGNCLEVTDAVSAPAAWRKSSHSNSDGGNCLEVADDYPDLIPVRDSKVPDGPILGIPTTAWAPFIDAIQRNAL